jgi:hypothetical protein
MATEAPYSDDTVSAALEYARVHGIAEAAREFDLPRGTVWRWARKHGLLATVAPKQTQAQVSLREELREALLEQALDLLERMNQPHFDYRGKDVEKVEWPTAPSGDCRNYAVAAAVLLDKYRLELGEATSREERGYDWDGAMARLRVELTEQ